MCIRKIIEWFNKPEPIPEPTGSEKLIDIFYIGDYPGSQNDLTGPPYDSINVKGLVESNYPDYAINIFANSQVTRSIFKQTITDRISAMKSGDKYIIYYSGHGTNGIDLQEVDGKREGLYLFDGTYWDDEFAEHFQNISEGAEVIVILDSCFAHGSTEIKSIKSKRKSRFVYTQEVPPNARLIRKMKKEGMKGYAVIAACQENQTSSDIGLKGGAFTYYWIKSWNKEFTWQQWIDKTAQTVNQYGYDQIPNIEGDPLILNKTIFK